MLFRSPVLFLLLLFSSAASMFGATYYVSPYGSDWWFGNSPFTPWATIAKVNSANLRAGDQVYFLRGGTWRETLIPQSSGLYYGAYGSGARPIITGADKVSQTLFQPSGAYWTPSSNNTWVLFLPNIPPQVWFNGVLGTEVKLTPQSSGFYTNYPSGLSPNQWYHDQAYLYVYSTENPGFFDAPLIEATQRFSAITVQNVSSLTVEHLNFTQAYSAALMNDGNVGTLQFNDDFFTDSFVSGVSSYTGYPVVNGSEILNNGIGLGVYGGTGFTLSDTIVSNSFTEAVHVEGTSGPSIVHAGTITGNGSHKPNSYTINNTTAHTLAADNSVMLPNPFEPKVYGFNGLTDAGNNVYTSEFPTTRSAPLIVVPFVDDYINLGVAQSVAAVAKSYGCPISYALNTKLLTASAWQSVAQLKAAGNEIVAHTRSHSDLSNNNVFSIQYTGTAATATMVINQTTNRLQTFLNGSTAPDLNLDLSNTYNGVIDVLGLIPAISHYTVAIQPNQNYFTPINLAATGPVNIKSVPYLTQASANYLTWEVEGAKADIAANLNGYQATAFATPFTGSNQTVENHIRDAGFASNRNGLLNADNSPDGNWLLSNLDVYNMAAEWLPFSFDATKSASSTGALVEGLGAAGGVMAVYSHGYNEFSLQNWTDLFANLKTLGASCMTMSQANAYIESKGTLFNDGTKKNWVETIPLRPNFAVTPLSPRVGAFNLQ